MKIFFLGCALLGAAFLITMTSFSALAQQDPQKLIGKWEGVDEKNDTGRMDFLDKGRVVFSMKEGTLPTMSYKIDPTHDPMRLDMILERSGQQKMILKCLIRLVDDHTIKMQVFPDGKRPDDFTTEDPLGTTIIMKKVG